MSNGTNSISEKIIWISTTFLFASFYIYGSTSYSSISLFILTVIIFLISAFQDKFKYSCSIDKYQAFVLAFVIYSFISSVWAWNSSYAVEKGVTLLEILACMSIIYWHYMRFNSVDRLLCSVMWAGYIVIIYTYFTYSADVIQTSISSGERLSSDFANINTIGMLGAVSVIICVYRLLFVKKSLDLSGIFLLPTFIIIAATGSRKALLMVIIGTLMVVFVRFKGRNFGYTIVKWTIVGIAVYFLLRFVLALPLFDAVNSRMEGLFAMLTGSGEIDHSAYIRQQFTLTAFKKFLEYPIVGIGMGNARIVLLSQFGLDTYTHNNFVELLLNGGIIGFALYYSMYIYLLYWIYKTRQNRSFESIICVILILLQIMMDYGAVSYYSKSTYFYFMLFLLHIKNMRSEVYLDE